MSNVPVTTEHENEQFKQVFLISGNLQVSAQIDKKNNAAYFAVEDTDVKSVGHELAIGLRNGKAFIQVSEGKKIKIVDLMELLSKVS